MGQHANGSSSTTAPERVSAAYVVESTTLSSEAPPGASTCHWECAATTPSLGSLAVVGVVSS